MTRPWVAPVTEDGRGLCPLTAWSGSPIPGSPCRWPFLAACPGASTLAPTRVENGGNGPEREGGVGAGDLGSFLSTGLWPGAGSTGFLVREGPRPHRTHSRKESGRAAGLHHGHPKGFPPEGTFTLFPPNTAFLSLVGRQVWRSEHPEVLDPWERQRGGGEVCFRQCWVLGRRRGTRD